MMWHTHLSGAVGSCLIAQTAHHTSAPTLPPPVRPRRLEGLEHTDASNTHTHTHTHRSAIAEQAQGNNACSLQALLQNLPRHLLLPVFNAYCEWAASTDKERGGPFQTLLDAGPPKMDAHLRIVLGISEEEAASAQVSTLSQRRVLSHTHIMKIHIHTHTHTHTHTHRHTHTHTHTHTHIHTYTQTHTHRRGDSW